MDRNIDFEDLKDNVKRNVKSLRYLENVMDGCEGGEDYEPCFIMAQKFIKHIANELEQEAK